MVRSPQSPPRRETRPPARCTHFIRCVPPAAASPPAAAPAAFFLSPACSAEPGAGASTVTRLDTRPQDSPLSAFSISLSADFSLSRLCVLRVATRSPRSPSIFLSAALPAALRAALPSRSLASFSSPRARKRVLKAARAPDSAAGAMEAGPWPMAGAGCTALLCVGVAGRRG